MSDQDDELGVLRRARGLSEEIEPARDLWPDIRAALDEPVLRPGRWRMPSALAASILLGAVAVAVLLRAEPEPAPAGAPATRPALIEVGLVPELAQSRAQLIASLDAELAQMSPGVPGRGCGKPQGDRDISCQNS